MGGETQWTVFPGSATSSKKWEPFREQREGQSHIQPFTVDLSED